MKVQTILIFFMKLLTLLVIFTGVINLVFSGKDEFAREELEVKVDKKYVYPRARYKLI